MKAAPSFLALWLWSSSTLRATRRASRAVPLLNPLDSSTR
jgi:hypothetical protein